jgi:hypothetical protein
MLGVLVTAAMSAGWTGFFYAIALIVSLFVLLMALFRRTRPVDVALLIGLASLAFAAWVFPSMWNAFDAAG